jgi:membrane protease YdiL (CAAX protease family)
MAVSFTDSVKPHLAVLPPPAPSWHTQVGFDYSHATGFVLACELHAGTLVSLHNCPEKCSYQPMPWDFWVIFFVLLVLIPWRGRVRLRRLLAQPVMGTRQKLVLYGSTIASQWILLGFVAWRSLARGLTMADLGLAHRVSPKLVLVALAGAVALGAFQSFNLRRLSHRSGAVPDLMRKLAERLLPGRRVELAPYCALAVTAGVCEEFVYRGFAMAALTRAGVSAWGVVVITAILFGMAHAYQGKSGIVATTLMGLVLGIFRVVYQSLIPPVIWHSAVDVAAGVAGPKYLLPSTAKDG